jgi:Pyruvate/2-oxoacid:ferredoxin oxidoreductase delta subunit
MGWPGILIAAAVVLLGTLWLVGERGRWLRRSTWRVWRENGWWSIFTFRGWHGYIYSRWPRQYIGWAILRLVPLRGGRAKRHLADHYHGKVLTPEHARTILTLNKNIPLQDLDQIIPYPAARRLVLAGPPEVVAFECPCRHTRPNPCQPTQVCLIVGQPFVDFVLEHHPADSRRLTQAEAVELLDAEHRRGHVHAAWFKNVCLDRFFAICNCCKCCCGGIEVMVRHGIPMMTSSGYLAEVDDTKCAACGECRKACPFDAIRVDGHALIQRAACLGCGICVEQCGHHALRLVRDPSRGVPLDVRLLV